VALFWVVVETEVATRGVVATTGTTMAAKAQVIEEATREAGTTTVASVSWVA